MSEFKTGKNPCPRCRERGLDHSGDNLYYYGEGLGAYCYSCGFTIPSDGWLKENGKEQEYIYEEEVVTKELITREEVEKIKGYTGTDPKGYRGISLETSKKYMVRYQYDEETGEVSHQYYGITQGGKAAGFKIRQASPKDFRSVGVTGKHCDLFGEASFKNASGRFLVLSSGELDALSAFEMFEATRKNKDDFEPIPVLSATIGESGAAKQYALRLELFERFERIVVIPDQDEAGKAALKEIVKVIPKGKMFVMNLPMKDCNEMLVAGKARQFTDCFWKMSAYTPDGIIGSGDISDKMREELSTPKIPLPPFMHKLQKMMAGGIPLGRIVNLGSASGTGKSTIVDEMLYYWIFNSPHKIGVVSLESDSGQYGLKVLSRHISQKIELFETPEEAIAFINQPWVLEKERELLYTEDGQHRWHLVEDRDGGTESMKAQIIKLIVECGCKVIVLDPLQDILDGMSNEEQAVFLRWLKGMIKSHGVTFINVNHVRKSGGGQKANSVGADLHEEDFAGSSTIFKSGACNLIFSRNKEAEDEIERNTTHLKMSKCRWTGYTGMSGEYYYHNESHTLWDKEDWLSKRGGGF